MHSAGGVEDEIAPGSQAPRRATTSIVSTVRAGRAARIVRIPVATGLVSSAGNPGNGDSGTRGGIAISDDGRYVVFTSTASNLVTGDANGTQDVFVHDRESGQTVRP